jgi:hypothetical protein
MSETGSNWYEANQQALLDELASMRLRLEVRAGGQAEAPAPAGAGRDDSALDALVRAFSLTPFERAILVLCAGVELDGRFPTLCAEAQGDPRRTYATFSLALGMLPDAHWSALTPAAPLRYWRLVELVPGEGLTLGALRIDEHILHFLAGVSYLDERVAGLIEPLPIPEPLPDTHAGMVERIVAVWSSQFTEGNWPVVQLCGDDSAAIRAVLATALARLHIPGYALRPANIPAHPPDRDLLLRLWEREAILTGAALLIEGGEGDEALRASLPFIDSLHGLLAVSSRDPVPLRRPPFRLDIARPTAAEQRLLWQEAAGPLAAQLDGSLDLLVAQFNLSPAAIRAAGAGVHRAGGATATAHKSAQEPTDEAGEQSPDDAKRAHLFLSLWDACRVQARPRLEDLAQRIDPFATWDDLVLPERERATLREIAAHVRRRSVVYERWGFAARSARGLGISALFAGTSGTGKTLAAEVLANELRLDLYRIDLSQVVSKYIGETEKNLRRVFDAAEAGGAILLFDEADALFGRRSEVKDSHDRYANIEVSYLLQRMESYRGLAILTTNLKSALDTAFMRRIRFVVPFPFPDSAQRAEIWRRIFPPATPTEGLDVERLARLNIAGGNIRNIALGAAFLAADEGVPVRMKHMLQAARSEYVKLEKPLTEVELGGRV